MKQGSKNEALQILVNNSFEITFRQSFCFAEVKKKGTCTLPFHVVTLSSPIPNPMYVFAFVISLLFLLAPS